MSAHPQIYLPRGTRPGEGWEEEVVSPITKKKYKRPTLDFLRHLEHFGRRIGKPHGSHIDDLSATKKTIWLCFACKSKFNYKSAHYFYEKNLRVRGNCDACKNLDNSAHLFIHESLLTDPGGKSRHGHVWTPRQGGR